MIGTYAPHPDGGFLVDTPAGVPMRTLFDEDRLRGMGYAPRPGLTQPGSQALAFGDSPSPAEGGGGMGNVPRSVSDVPMGGPGSSAGGAPGTLDQGGGVGAPADERMTPRAELDTRRGERASPAEGLRGGGEVKDLKLESGGSGSPGYSAPRFAMVPAADRRAAFSVEKSGADPADVQQYERASGDAFGAKLKAGENINARTAIDLGVDAAQAGYDAREAERAAIEAEHRKNAMFNDYQRRAAAIDSERAAVSNMDTKPEKLFGGSDWGKAVSAFSVLAGGVFMGLKGGKNPALEALNDIVDRRTAAKRYEYEKAKDTLAGHQSDFGRLVQIFGTPEAAEQEMRLRKRMALEAWATKRVKELQLANMPDQWAMQVADWQKQNAADTLDLHQKVSDHVREQYLNAPAHAVQVGGERPLKPDERERKVELGDGTHGYARSAKQADEVQGKLTPGRNILSSIADLEALAKEARAVNITPVKFDAIKSRMQSIADGVAPMMNVQAGQGAMAQPEADRQARRLGNADAIIRGESDKALQETRHFQERLQRSIASDYLYADPGATQSFSRPEAGGLRREQ